MHGLSFTVIDDDDLFRSLMHDHLGSLGAEVRSAETGQGGFELIEQSPPDVAIIDLHLPDTPGVDILKQVMLKYPDTIALMVTGYVDVETSLQAMRMGAEDYLAKPINLEHLNLVIWRALEKRKLQRENDKLTCAALPTFCGELIGGSASMSAVYKDISKAARTDCTVLILGETGTGKELAARAIHEQSRRNTHPFFAINCSSIPATLLESELFGYVKGSFTGADRDKAGYFEAADGGTLLLDEIQSAPANVQAALLRVLDRKEVIPIGGRTPIPVNARVLVTCNRDLDTLIEKGEFREDLYYRILERSIHLPPLRERREDIPMLVEHFSALASLPEGVAPRRFSPKAMESLTQHSWPGNVRELRNTVIRIAEDAPRPVVRPADVPEKLVKGSATPYAFTPLSDIERRHVREALTHANGNKSEAALLLGVSRGALYGLLQKHEIM